jgi:soluble cytochrome b562
MITKAKGYSAMKTAKVIALTFSVLLVGQAGANETQPFDLKKKMQAMKLAFKQAAESQSVEQMKLPVADLNTLIAKSKNGSYPPEKQDMYMEGFEKLSVALDDVEQHLEQGELDKAKQSLRQIDDLRIEYHDQRNPSIWKKLFG